MYSNANSILPKLDELKTILGNAKAAVISITESKIDNFVSNAEIGIPCYGILRYNSKKYGGRVASYVRKIYDSIWEIFLLGHFNINFLHNGKNISK